MRKWKKAMGRSSCRLADVRNDVANGIPEIRGINKGNRRKSSDSSRIDLLETKKPTEKENTQMNRASIGKMLQTSIFSNLLASVSLFTALLSIAHYSIFTSHSQSYSSFSPASSVSSAHAARTVRLALELVVPDDDDETDETETRVVAATAWDKAKHDEMHRPRPDELTKLLRGSLKSMLAVTGEDAAKEELLAPDKGPGGKSSASGVCQPASGSHSGGKSGGDNNISTSKGDDSGKSSSGSGGGSSGPQGIVSGKAESNKKCLTPDQAWAKELNKVLDRQQIPHHLSLARIDSGYLNGVPMAIIESWSRECWTDGFWVTFERCCDPDVLTMSRPAYQGNLWRQERLLEGMFPSRLFQEDRRKNLKRRKLSNGGWTDKDDGLTRKGWTIFNENKQELKRKREKEEAEMNRRLKEAQKLGRKPDPKEATRMAEAYNANAAEKSGQFGTAQKPYNAEGFSYGPTTSADLDADSLFVSPKGAEITFLPNAGNSNSKSGKNGKTSEFAYPNEEPKNSEQFKYPKQRMNSFRNLYGDAVWDANVDDDSLKGTTHNLWLHKFEESPPVGTNMGCNNAFRSVQEWDRCCLSGYIMAERKLPMLRAFKERADVIREDRRRILQKDPEKYLPELTNVRDVEQQLNIEEEDEGNHNDSGKNDIKPNNTPKNDDKNQSDEKLIISMQKAELRRAGFESMLHAINSTEIVAGSRNYSPKPTEIVATPSDSFLHASKYETSSAHFAIPWQERWLVGDDSDFSGDYERKRNDDMRRSQDESVGREFVPDIVIDGYYEEYEHEAKFRLSKFRKPPMVLAEHFHKPAGRGTKDLIVPVEEFKRNSADRGITIRSTETGTVVDANGDVSGDVDSDTSKTSNKVTPTADAVTSDSLSDNNILTPLQEEKIKNEYERKINWKRYHRYVGQRFPNLLAESGIFHGYSRNQNVTERIMMLNQSVRKFGSDYGDALQRKKKQMEGKNSKSIDQHEQDHKAKSISETLAPVPPATQQKGFPHHTGKCVRADAPIGRANDPVCCDDETEEEFLHQSELQKRKNAGCLNEEEFFSDMTPAERSKANEWNLYGQYDESRRAIVSGIFGPSGSNEVFIDGAVKIAQAVNRMMPERREHVRRKSDFGKRNSSSKVSKGGTNFFRPKSRTKKLVDLVLLEIQQFPISDEPASGHGSKENKFSSSGKPLGFYRSRLKAAGWKICTVRCIRNRTHVHQPRWRHRFTYTKLRMFALVQYHQLVWLDSDVQLIGNIHGLLDFPLSISSPASKLPDGEGHESDPELPGTSSKAKKANANGVSNTISNSIHDPSLDPIDGGVWGPCKIAAVRDLLLGAMTMMGAGSDHRYSFNAGVMVFMPSWAQYFGMMRHLGPQHGPGVPAKVAARMARERNLKEVETEGGAALAGNVAGSSARPEGTPEEDESETDSALLPNDSESHTDYAEPALGGDADSAPAEDVDVNDANTNAAAFELIGKFKKNGALVVAGDMPFDDTMPNSHSGHFRFQWAAIEFAEKDGRRKETRMFPSSRITRTTQSIMDEGLVISHEPVDFDLSEFHRQHRKIAKRKRKRAEKAEKAERERKLREENAEKGRKLNVRDPGEENETSSPSDSEDSDSDSESPSPEDHEEHDTVSEFRPPPQLQTPDQLSYNPHETQNNAILNTAREFEDSNDPDSDENIENQIAKPVSSSDTLQIYPSTIRGDQAVRYVYDFTASEQGFLNDFYRDAWCHLPCKYNAVPGMALVPKHRWMFERCSRDTRILHWAVFKPDQCHRLEPRVEARVKAEDVVGQTPNAHAGAQRLSNAHSDKWRKIVLSNSSADSTLGSGRIVTATSPNTNALLPGQFASPVCPPRESSANLVPQQSQASLLKLTELVTPNSAYLSFTSSSMGSSEYRRRQLCQTAGVHLNAGDPSLVKSLDSSGDPLLVKSSDSSGSGSSPLLKSNFWDYDPSFQLNGYLWNLGQSGIEGRRLVRLFCYRYHMREDLYFGE